MMPFRYREEHRISGGGGGRREREPPKHELMEYGKHSLHFYSSDQLGTFIYVSCPSTYHAF